MIIGYRLECYENDSHMFDEDDPDWPRCPKCGFTTDFDYLSPMFELKRKNFDIAVTWDGRYTVSLKFKEFCLRHNYIGLEFRELPHDPNFFKFDISSILPFDVVGAGANLRRRDYCESCGNYCSITLDRIFLKDIDRPLSDSFYATDLRFAGENSRRRLMIIGVETYAKLKQEKFKGIFFKKILYPYELTPLATRTGEE